MKKIIIAILLLSSTAVAGPKSSPATVKETVAGKHELSGSTSASLLRTGGKTFLGAGVGYGYYLTDSVKPGVDVDFVVGRHISALALVPNLTYYADKFKSVVPFVSGGFGVVTTKIYSVTNTTAVLGLGAGIKIPFNERVSASTGIVYSRSFAGKGSNSFALPVGLSVLF